MLKIHIDFETRSKLDLNKCGAWKYASDPSTEILCMAYKIGDGNTELWVPPSPMPTELIQAVQSEDSVLVAHNAFFEQAVWNCKLSPKLPVEKWRCTLAKSANHALPRSLKEVGLALGLSTVKDNDGSRVMLQVSKPRKPSAQNSDCWYTKQKYPEKFKQLYEYCISDVQAEHAVDKYLRDLGKREQKIWFLDQKINHTGVYIDREALTRMHSLIEDYKEELRIEASKISNGSFTSVSQRDKVLSWISEMGETMAGYTKSDLEQALRCVKNDKVRRVLEIRKQTGKTSTAKYVAMMNAICEDSRIRDTLMYHGASTGRWSGKLVQFQNLPKGVIEDMDGAVELIKNSNNSIFKKEVFGKYTKEDCSFMDFASSLIRGMVSAPTGSRLIAADFASIEVRVLAWLVNCQPLLQDLRDGGDPYCFLASVIYGKPINKKDHPEERSLGKAAVLGCGFQMGAERFSQTCRDSGMRVSEYLARLAVNAYRSKYKEIRDFWYLIEDTAIRAVRSGKPQAIGKITFFMHGDFLHAKLPSKRTLKYFKPSLELAPTPWGQEKYKLSFFGINSVTRKFESQNTYGGKLTENVVQAVARDIQADSMLRLDKAGYKLVMSVHDESVAEVPNGFGSVQEFCEIMKQPPSWAIDCPIDVEGSEMKHYRK